MTEPVAHAAHIPPWQAGIAYLGFAPKARCRLTYDLQLALDGSDGLGILSKDIEIHAGSELLDKLDGLGNIAK